MCVLFEDLPSDVAGVFMRRIVATFCEQPSEQVRSRSTPGQQGIGFRDCAVENCDDTDLKHHRNKKFFEQWIAGDFGGWRTRAERKNHIPPHDRARYAETKYGTQTSSHAHQLLRVSNTLNDSRLLCEEE